MEIPHEDQSSHYDHEKDKFAYLSMRDRIELGKRQVQQSQWGSKYALNEDISMKAKLASMARMIEEFELRNVHTEAQPQAMPTSFEYINHPNLTTQPQPQPSMSTSSLEQAILKISKVMEDFVGEQQKINSHLNEKIDNMESSINLRMEGVYNDLSLRIEKVQDSIEKLTNLDIARGKRKLPPQPHHNLQGTNTKRLRKVLKIDTLVGDCYDNSMDQPSIENHKVQDDKGLPESFKASTSPGKRRETNSLGPNGKDANFVWDPGGIQHEVGIMLAKIEAMVKTKENRGEKPKQSNSHHPISATESIASNGARFGVETKKLWSLQENCTELSGNFAHLNPRCENFRTVRITLLAHERKPIFAPCESRCENFAHHYSRCEIHSKVRKSQSKVRIRVRKFLYSAPHFATVGHVFGALSGAQIMHTIYQFEAWEVRNLVFQTVHDLDLKRRSYGRLQKCFFPFGCKTWPPSYDMASKLQNDMQKHFAKPRKLQNAMSLTTMHLKKRALSPRSHMKPLTPFLTS
ncbi:hypothetical protein AAG906_038839 [Vitis piasezkii]